MRTVTEGDFHSQILSSPIPVLVDFGASWCVPCQQLAKTLESMEDDYAGRVSFVRMDVDECQEITDQLGIKSIPTLVLVKQGEAVLFLVGMQSQGKLDSILKDC